MKSALVTSSDGAQIEILQPNSFEQANHFYPKVLNSQIHPLAAAFLNLGNERIISLPPATEESGYLSGMNCSRVLSDVRVFKRARANEFTIAASL